MTANKSSLYSPAPSITALLMHVWHTSKISICCD